MSSRITKFLGDIEFEVDGQKRLTSNFITSDEATQLIQDKLKDYTPNNPDNPSTPSIDTTELTSKIESNSEKITKIEEQLTEIKNKPSNSDFTVSEGYSDFHVTRDNLVEEEDNYLKKLSIQMNDTGINKLLQIDNRIDVFKINLRKKILFDADGRVIQTLSIYVKNKHFVCPEVVKTDGKKVRIQEQNSVKPYIGVDKNIEIDLKSLFIHGEISIIYLLPLNQIVLSQPSIKCDIIDSKNSIKLHESDNLYLYKPSIITEETLTDKNNEKLDVYTMIWKIPSDYVIPEGLKFEFKEQCFGNRWTLEYNNGRWIGANVKGKINGKIINKRNEQDPGKGESKYQERDGAVVMIKKSPINIYAATNRKVWNEPIMKKMWEGATIHPKILFKDGTIEEGEKYGLTFKIEQWLAPYFDGDIKYDSSVIRAYIDSFSTKKDILNFDNWERVYLDFTLNGSTDAALNRLSFIFENLYTGGADYDRNYMSLIGDLDTIEK